MPDAPLATRARSTGGIAIPPASHVVGAPLEPTEVVDPPTSAVVLSRTTAHIRSPLTLLDPPIKIVQLESRGSFFTALVAPELALPEIGDEVRLEPRAFREDGDRFTALVVVDVTDGEEA